jgi:hypothetical protein
VLVGLGTGPFFGEKAQFHESTMAENMDLSPFPNLSIL